MKEVPKTSVEAALAWCEAVLGPVQVISDHSKMQGDHESATRRLQTSRGYAYLKIHQTQAHWNNEVHAHECWSRAIGNAAPDMLAGGNVGKIFVNDPARPLWGLVREKDDGTLYQGGCVEQQILSEAVSMLQKDGYVCLVYQDGDPDFDLFPPNPDDSVECLEFDRPIGSSALTPYLANIPAGFTVTRMDRTLLEHSPRSEGYLSRYGSFENLLDRGIPVYVLHENEPVCEAFADMEIGIRTQKAYRLQGFATIACAYLIRLCDEAGSATYWDCVKSNLGSVKLARKLGFQNEPTRHWCLGQRNQRRTRLFKRKGIIQCLRNLPTLSARALSSVSPGWPAKNTSFRKRGWKRPNSSRRNWKRAATMGSASRTN